MRVERGSGGNRFGIAEQFVTNTDRNHDKLARDGASSARLRAAMRAMNQTPSIRRAPGDRWSGR
jgi:hypothetical protein